MGLTLCLYPVPSCPAKILLLQASRLGTAPAPHTCSLQELVVPDTQGYGGDEGQEEQDQQHHGQDDEGVPIRAGGEEGVTRVGWFDSPSPNRGQKRDRSRFYVLSSSS